MSQITNIEFFSGGRAFFSVQNNKEKHYTYKIVKYGDTPYFVFVLVAPGDKWIYMGCYEPSRPHVRMTSKSHYLPDSKIVIVFDWAVKWIYFKREIPEGYSILHSGKCCVCGRKLTNPESIKAGIGPFCLEEREKSHEKRGKLGIRSV